MVKFKDKDIVSVSLKVGNYKEVLEGYEVSEEIRDDGSKFYSLVPLSSRKKAKVEPQVIKGRSMILEPMYQNIISGNSPVQIGDVVFFEHEGKIMKGILDGIGISGMIGKSSEVSYYLRLAEDRQLILDARTTILFISENNGL